MRSDAPGGTTERDRETSSDVRTGQEETTTRQLAAAAVAVLAVVLSSLYVARSPATPAPAGAR